MFYFFRYLVIGLPTENDFLAGLPRFNQYHRAWGFATKAQHGQRRLGHVLDPIVREI